MMESFKICQVVRQGTDEYALRPVDSVPGDSVCTLYVGGNGMVDEARVKNTGQIVDKEILRYVADIPNYVVMYDYLTVTENRDERLIEMNKQGCDVLPRLGTSMAVYLNAKNVNEVYRRQILPVFVDAGLVGLTRISFVVDGNKDEIMSQIIKRLRHAMTVIDCPERNMLGTFQIILTHTYPYSDYVPPYIQEMFNQVLLPRISDGQGHRLDLGTVLRRVRKLNLLAQCHGAHVIRMMEQIMTKTMGQMGYSKDEIKQIQSQLLVVAYAPSCTLGDSNFQFISFMSAYDYIVDVPHNWVSEFVSAHRMAEIYRYLEHYQNWPWFLPPMFLGGKNGNAFIVKHRFQFDPQQWAKQIQKPRDNRTHVHKAEHNDQHFLPLNATEDGILLGMFARNIVINGIKNSLAQGAKFTPSPPIKELVLDEPGNKNIQCIFDDMIQNGDDFMHYVREFAKDNNADIHVPDGLQRYILATERKR